MMSRYLLLLLSIGIFIITTAFLAERQEENLRALYSKPISEWPKPFIDPGVDWKEFEALEKQDTSYFRIIAQPKVHLGKILFFDPMLSGSNQISCSSCHDPQSSWADKRSVALGNDHLEGNRNTLSLLNVASRKTFFWDGRAGSLEDQAKEPIVAHHEMAMKPEELGDKLGAIEGYRDMFKDAYGDEQVTYDRVLESLAAFQKTIVSRQSRFDRFLNGDYDAMTDEEIKGMHLFRNKARCMNCHNGKFLTDEDFHNIGLTYYKRKYEDLGRYNITKNPEDVGKFRTPSLRDVMHNSPWMHNGLFNNITGIINMYNSGMHMIDPDSAEKAADPLYPVTDELMQPLDLNKEEIQALIAFMDAITATQYHMRRPELPR